MMELDGMRRFVDDPEWGEILKRFREGTVTPEDIDEMNKRLAKDDENNLLPANIQCTACCDRDRDAINAASFEKRRLADCQRWLASLFLFFFWNGQQEMMMSFGMGNKK